MKLLFSNEWLRRMISSDPDIDPEAGPSLIELVESTSALEHEPVGANLAVLSNRSAAQLRISLGKFVHDLRLREGLSIGELAHVADVSEDELTQVERDPHFTATARLIYKLSEYFDVELRLLSQMSGTTRAVDRRFFNAAIGYAAKSEDLSSLTDDQRQVLDGFIKALSEYSVSTK